MKKILLVCYGNVGRSQMAEAFYNHLTNSSNSWSAGIQEDTPARYGTPASMVVESMLELGIDISRARVKTISPKIIDESEKIVVMCDKNLCPDFLLRSENIIFWDIDDPFEMTIDKTRDVRDVIKGKISSLISEKGS